MIELLMLLAIGALAACLVAIALLPALWRRAVRLTRAELQATLPVTPEEVAAEKDQIRAVGAVEQRRLEQRAEAVSSELHLARTDIGEKTGLIQRHEATIAARIDEISALTTVLAARDDEIAGLKDTVATLERERDNLATNLSASRISNQALDQEGINLRQSAEQRQARLDEQDRQIEGLLEKIAEIQSVSGTLRAELQQRTEELRAAARSLRETTARSAILERKLAGAEGHEEERARLVAQLQDERLRLIEEAGAASRERDALRIDTTGQASQIANLERRASDLETLLDRSRGQGSDLVRDLMRTIESLRQEKRQADDEISTMRFEKARIEAQLARQKPRAPLARGLPAEPAE